MKTETMIFSNEKYAKLMIEALEIAERDSMIQNRTITHETIEHEYEYEDGEKRMVKRTEFYVRPTKIEFLHAWFRTYGELCERDKLKQ